MKKIVSFVTALVMLLGLLAIHVPSSAEDAWVSIYANHIGSSSFDTENTQSLLLADLNVDGTPELLRMQMGGGMGETVMQPMMVSGSSIVMCSGSNAVYLGYMIQKFSFNLYRKDNHSIWVIVVDCPTDSIGSDFIHKVFEISMSGKTVKAVGRFELRGTQSGGRIYYRDGKKVSKSTYNNSYSSYFKNPKSLNMSAIEGDTSAWNKDSSTRINAFNAMVSRYRSELQSAIPVTKVSLNKTKISLALGKTYTLKASVSPSFALNKAITWRSDNTSVATVNGGTVKAVGYGTAKITATAPSGKYGVCSISVPRPSANKVTINSSSSEISTGSSLELTASVSPAAASQVVTWTSSKKSVATVDSKGFVKGVKPGIIKITAKASNGKSATKTVRVKAAPPVGVTSVSVSPSTVSLDIGKTQQLSATVQPSNATDKALTWSSSDISLVTVSSTGLVTAKKAGAATITAKAKNGVNGTSIIYVGTGSKTSIAEGVYNVKNAASGLMLDVTGSGSADHTNVQVFPTHTGNNQRWIVRNSGSDIYTLIPMHATSAALDVSTGVMQPGQNIQIYHQNQSAAQEFCFYKEANGNYTIRPNTASYLTVQAEGTTAESNVALGSYGIGNTMQQWNLMKVADVPTPGGGYNPELAAQFAHENWNKDPGTSNMCARFVSRCLIAGGIQMTEIAGTGPLASYLKGLGKQMDVVSLDELNRTIKTGDVICFWWTDNTGSAISHVAICCGRDCGGGTAGVPWLCAWTNDRHYQVSRMASAARQIAIIRMS